MGSIIRSSGTMSYSLVYFNSQIGFNGLKYLYSVISVIDKRLPGDTKKWTLVRSWTARVRLAYPWAESCPVRKFEVRYEQVIYEWVTYEQVVYEWVTYHVHNTYGRVISHTNHSFHIRTRRGVDEVDIPDIEVCCNVLQSVVVWCSVWLCVAARCCAL